MNLINPKDLGIDPAKIETIQENAVTVSANLVAISSDVRYIVSVLRKLAAQLDKPTS